MDINLQNFNVRKTNPYEAGVIGLPEGVERYIAKAMGLTGIEIFKGDQIFVKNIEGGQIVELTIFDKQGKCSPGLIGLNSDSDANFAKQILSNKLEEDYLLSKLVLIEEKLNKSGVLIISGFLFIDIKDLNFLLKDAKFVIINIIHLNDWVSMVLKKK